LRSHKLALSHHIVYEADSLIVGSRLAFVQHLAVKGSIALSRQGVDVAVHPGYHGRGIGSQMQAFGDGELRKTFDLNMGTTGNPLMSRLDMKLGYRPVLNQLRIFSRDLDGPDETLVGDAAESADWAIGEVSTFDRSIDSFCKEAVEPFEFAVLKTSEYLNWRYCDPRAGMFAVRVASGADRALGVAVLRISGERGFIADLLALPGRLDIAGALISDACRCLAVAGASRVAFCCPVYHPYRTVLKDLGFIESARTIPFAYRPMRMSETELAFLGDADAAVHIMFGDFDIV
jgi:hypothetical protein